jgi:putative ABC transport system substrate-binding protein
MRRRAVLVGLFAAPLARRVLAEEGPRIAILPSGFPNRAPIHFLFEELRALGYEDGRRSAVS